MFKVDNSKVRKLERDLERFKDRAVPFAVRDTLNRTAFDARRLSVRKVRTEMVLRNKGTEQSIQVDKARGLNVQTMESTIGSTQGYMEDQEFGATKTSRGKRGTPIPTSAASGEGRGVVPRKKAVPRSRTLGRITLRNERIKTKSKKQANFLKVKLAAKSGHKFVFLSLQRHPGIYRVSGGKRNPQIDLMYDMSQKSVFIPRNPWLKPSVDKATERMPEFYRRSLTFQLKKHRLFID